ncbi:MAG: hypothetical protein AAGL98_02730 [Planctomycetota bacterium]
MSRGKWIGLAVAAVVLAAGYWWVYGGNRVPPIEVMAVDLPGSPLIFSFNDQVAVEQVMVFRPAEGADPDDDLAYIEGDMMWHLIRREAADDPGAADQANEPPPIEPTSVVRYGRGLWWLAPPAGRPRRGQPLEAGVSYVFVAELAEGRAQVEFTHVDNGG